MNGLLERMPDMQEGPYPNLPEDFRYAGTVVCGELVEVESSDDVMASNVTTTDDADTVRGPILTPDGDVVPVRATSFDAPEDSGYSG